MEQINEFPFYCSSPSGVWHYAILNKKICIAICAEKDLECINIIQTETAMIGGFIKVEKALVARMFISAQKQLWERAVSDINLFDPYGDDNLKRDLAAKYNIPTENVEIFKGGNYCC